MATLQRLNWDCFRAIVEFCDFDAQVALMSVCREYNDFMMNKVLRFNGGLNYHGEDAREALAIARKSFTDFDSKKLLIKFACRRDTPYDVPGAPTYHIHLCSVSAQNTLYVRSSQIADFMGSKINPEKFERLCIIYSADDLSHSPSIEDVAKFTSMESFEIIGPPSLPTLPYFKALNQEKIHNIQLENWNFHIDGYINGETLEPFLFHHTHRLPESWSFHRCHFDAVTLKTFIKNRVMEKRTRVTCLNFSKGAITKYRNSDATGFKQILKQVNLTSLQHFLAGFN